MSRDPETVTKGEFIEARVIECAQDILRASSGRVALRSYDSPTDTLFCHRCGYPTCGQTCIR